MNDGLRISIQDYFRVGKSSTPFFGCFSTSRGDTSGTLTECLIDTFLALLQFPRTNLLVWANLCLECSATEFTTVADHFVSALIPPDKTTLFLGMKASFRFPHLSFFLE